MTLTKKFLLKEFKPQVTKFEHESVGDFYIKPRTELQRCKRIGEMYDKKGNVIQSVFNKRRAYSLIDQLCDEQGNNLFTEGEIQDVLALNSEKLDPILEAIAIANGEQEKNEPGE